MNPHPSTFRKTTYRFLSICLAATGLLALAHGCATLASTGEARALDSAPSVTIVGFADRDIIKAHNGLIDPGLFEQQIHQQTLRDAWLHMAAYTQGVAFHLVRATPADPPHITFAEVPLPSSPALVPDKAEYHALGTGLSLGFFTFAPAKAALLKPAESLAALPIYLALAGYPANPAPGEQMLPLLTVHELALENCYREAILRHLAATHQEKSLSVSGRVFPTSELRTWYLNVSAGDLAPDETSPVSFDRRICRMEMKVRVQLDASPIPAPPMASAPRKAPSAGDAVDHAARGCPVTLARPYLPNYSGGGPNALTDGLLASSLDLNDPAWQGVAGDLDAVIDLGHPIDVRVLCSRFFQKSDAAVLLPAEVQYWLSSDGKDFHKAATITNGISINENEWTKEFWAQLERPQSARYVKVIAKNQARPSGGWLFADEVLVNPASRVRSTKPIRGTWLVLGNANDTTEYWQNTVAECASLGMDYLVIQFVAMNGHTFYPSKVLPQAKQACPDSLEAVLAAADKAGLKVFVSNGFAGRGESSQGSPEIDEIRRGITREIAQNYAGHPSFYGWYWPDEASINGHFPPDFAAYISDCSAMARKLTPRARLLIAPYGGRFAADDQQYRDQLRKMDLDIICYQDEVGCNRVGAYDDYWSFRRLQKIHNDVPKIELWAELECFDLQGSKWTSPQFPRVQAQIENLSPFVKNILIYQFIDTMRHPPGPGEEQPPEFPLLADYRDWLKKNHPTVPRQ